MLGGNMQDFRRVISLSVQGPDRAVGAGEMYGFHLTEDDHSMVVAAFFQLPNTTNQFEGILGRTDQHHLQFAIGEVHLLGV